MRDTNASRVLCARVLGTSTSTIGRRLHADYTCNPIRPARPLSSPRAHAAAREIAAIKRAELTEMERERKAACARVVITQPGITRGFDAMHLPSVASSLY